MDLSSVTASMDRIGDGVVAALVEAQATVTTTWTANTEVKAQVFSGLAQISLQVEKLVGPWKQAVLSGQWTFSKWAALAKEQHDTIRSFVPEIGQWSFAGVVSATASQTAADVKKLLQQGGEALKFAVPSIAIYIVVVLVLLAVIRVGR